MADIETRTLRIPGATLTYDPHGDLHGLGPRPLLLIGSPMVAGGFGTRRGTSRIASVVTFPGGQAVSWAADSA